MKIKKTFSTKGYYTFISGFFKENAICCQLLGFCSALAITNKVENALAMSGGVIFVLIVSSMIISFLKDLIPSRYRIITYMIVISTPVICFDQYLKAYAPVISRQLGPYVGLIITNCILMGRLDSFALKNSPKYSFLDALGSGLSYSYSLLLIAAFREILAFGTLLNIQVMPQSAEKWVVMAMAPGAFFILAVYLWIFRIAARIKN